MKLVKVTTRGHVRCCGVPMRNLGPLPALGCRQCGKHMDANDPVWIGRNSWKRLRKKYGQREYKGLHVLQDFSPHACTGLHCRRPECRKRRKERLRKAWEERRATGDVRRMNELKALFRQVFSEQGRLVQRGHPLRRRWRRSRGPAYRADQDLLEASRVALLPKVTIQDDRWRLEVEVKALKYAYPLLLTQPVRYVVITGLT